MRVEYARTDERRARPRAYNIYTAKHDIMRLFPSPILFVLLQFSVNGRLGTSVDPTCCAYAARLYEMRSVRGTSPLYKYMHLCFCAPLLFYFKREMRLLLRLAGRGPLVGRRSLLTGVLPFVRCLSRRVA